MSAALSNPHHRRRRYHRRRNPFNLPSRGNPTFMGLNVEDAAGTVGGLAATATVDQLGISRFASEPLAPLGKWRAVATAAISAVLVGMGARRFSRKWAGRMDNGQAAYVGIVAANTFMPGTLGITVDPPKPVSQWSNRFVAQQPPVQALPAATAAPTTAGAIATVTRPPRVNI